MVNLAIKGHETRGKEVIELLEMLGGKSYTGLAYKGEDPDRCYCINKYSNFIDSPLVIQEGQVFSLEEFLEKYPYKIGDKVTHLDYESPLEIVGMKCENDSIKYEVYTNDYGYWFGVDELQPYKEEAMEEIKIDIPKGYEFAGVDDDNQQVVFTKIQSQYPKTYEECHKLTVQWKEIDCNPNSELILCDAPIHDFCKLIVARNIYWKITGEQMGLDKPWKPDFTNDNEERYGIYTTANKVEKDFCGVGDVNVILTFPTEEMRDAFYENFKDLIEQCKELL